MKHVYFYYRVDPTHIDLATTQIDCLQSAMARYCTQPPRRLSRCDDPSMWLEIYEDITDYMAFDTAMRLAVDTVNCASFTVGGRHQECFSDPDTQEATRPILQD